MITAKYNPALGIVEHVLADKVTVEDLRMGEVKCIALAKENNSNLFLSDCTQATFDVSTIAVLNLPEFYKDQGLSRPVRIAILSPMSKAGKELVRFYETVCLNRGWIVNVFKERQEALDWLLE